MSEVDRVLFVGNSYTYCQNLPALVSGLAASVPQSHIVEAGMVAKGDGVLAELWRSAVPSTLRSRQWDHVVLQEQSTLGPPAEIDGIRKIKEPGAFHDSLRVIVPQIHKLPAKPVLYLTWACQDDPPAQAKLTKAYRDIARELDIPVAPVGVTWWKALNEGTHLKLYRADRHHPAPAGSYLAACVLYATLFGRSPEGAAARISGPIVDDNGVPQEVGVLVDLPAADAEFLQRIAWETAS